MSNSSRRNSTETPTVFDKVTGCEGGLGDSSIRPLVRWEHPQRKDALSLLGRIP